MFSNLIHDSPIPQHPAIEVLDSTKIKTYLDCPRKFFYEYVLGWKPESQTKNHLVFGQAIHEAMEQIMSYGYSKESVILSMLRFEEIYREVFPESTDSEHFPKVPARALDALMDYIEAYKSDAFKVLYTETAGIILVSEDRELHFKMDLIAQEPTGQIFFMDYKTGSRLTKAWQDQWLMSIQMNLYTHALYCIYGLDADIFGGKVQGFIFNKEKTQLIRVPVRRTMQQLNAWLWNINKILDRMEQDFQDLTRVKPEHSVMEAFPQNPNSCSDYYGCPFYDFCSIGNQNPCANCQRAPLGMKVDFWDPREQEQKASNIFTQSENKAEIIPAKKKETSNDSSN